MDHNFALFNVFCICLLSLDLKNRLAASVVPIGRTRTRVKEICRKEVILKASCHWWISNTKVTKVLSLGLVYLRSFWYVAVFWWFLCYIWREKEFIKKNEREKDWPWHLGHNLGHKEWLVDVRCVIPSHFLNGICFLLFLHE